MGYFLNRHVSLIRGLKEIYYVSFTFFSLVPSSQISPCFAAVRSLHHVQLFATQWIAAHQAPISFTISQSLFKLTSIELMLVNQLIICHLLLLLPSIFPSISCFPVSRLFASGGQSIEASASVLVLPMNVQDWFSLGLAGLISILSKRLKSLLQHHSSKALILWHLDFFMVQLSHLYMTTGKTVAWSIQTSVNKVITPLFNTLSRLSLLFFQYTYIHILRGLFLGLKFFYWSICLSLSHCLIYCCFVVVIEVR